MKGNHHQNCKSFALRRARARRNPRGAEAALFEPARGARSRHRAWARTAFKGTAFKGAAFKGAAFKGAAFKGMGWGAVHAFSYLLVAGMSACVPGSLSEEEQAGFHNELARLYGQGDASTVGADGTAAPSGAGLPGGSQSPPAGAPSTLPSAPPASAAPPPSSTQSPGGVEQPGAAPGLDTPQPPGSGSAVQPPPAEPPPVEPPPVEPPPAEPPPVEPPPAEPPPAVIDPCVTEVFTSSCAGTVCHYAGIVNLPPDLERDNLFDLLTTEPSTCADATTGLIDLDDPAQSYLMQKIRGEQPATCGGPMPPAGSPPLTDAQLQCLESWFASL